MKAISSNTSDVFRTLYLLKCPDSYGIKCRLLTGRIMFAGALAARTRLKVYFQHLRRDVLVWQYKDRFLRSLFKNVLEKYILSSTQSFSMRPELKCGVAVG